jgi:Domain of unknown function (DUF4365)
MSVRKSKIDRNSLGDRGESILAVALLTFHGNAPLFRLAHLGAKWPTADYAVELVAKPGRFFLIQVKTTQKGMQKNRRLQIQVVKAKYNALASTPVPRYVVGVDNDKEDAFICAATKLRQRQISSLTTAHSLKLPETRRLLFEEVDAFWTAVGRKHFNSSAFTDT